MNLFILKFFIPLLMLHPVHVSLTNIEYNKSNNSFEITLKFFKDDFKKIVKQKTGISINVADGEFVSNEKEAVGKYINSHLKISWCKPITKACFGAKEIDDLAVWYHLSIPLSKHSGALKVTNSFLLDLYSDQTNLLIYTDATREISEMMSKSKETIEIIKK